MKKWLYNNRYDIAIGVVIVAFIVLFLSIKQDFGFLSDREAFQDFIRGFGAWAPFMIVLVIVAEVIIAPIPGFIPIASAGFIFGTVEGAIYSYIGNVIGSMIVFFIARKFGRYVVVKLVNEERLTKYEAAIKRRENILLLLYFFPVFPVDMISIAFGLSDIKLKKYATYMAIGFVSNVFILNYFGDYLAKLYF